MCAKSALTDLSDVVCHKKYVNRAEPKLRYAQKYVDRIPRNTDKTRSSSLAQG